jgi:hypothetical protein
VQNCNKSFTQTETMALTEALKAARIIETLENYAVAGNTVAAAEVANAANSGHAHTDDSFWRRILNEPESCWNQSFYLKHCVLSYWTPRMPGLFYAPGSAAMRAAADKQEVARGPGWKEFTPMGKSSKVMGGVGTFTLPPDNAGFALGCVSFSANTSSGIPVLISPEVAEAHKLTEGCVVSVIEARWTKMNLDWAQRFPSIKGIPRGYLLVNKPEMIEVEERNAPTELHPFTVMEYEQNGALLFDYVYVTANTSQTNYRQEAEKFFEYYRTKDNRHGKYLLACDAANPLFDATYQSPGELHKELDTGKMELLLNRIRETRFDNHTLDELAAKLTRFYPTAADMHTLACHVGLPPGSLKDDSAAKMSLELLSESVERKIVEELIDRMAMTHPGVFQTAPNNTTDTKPVVAPAANDQQQISNNPPFHQSS